MNACPTVEQGTDGKWYALEHDDDAWNGPFDTEREALRHAFGDTDEEDAESINS